MRIILKERVENLGVLGDVVNVKAGYARNYLVPFGKGVQATDSNIALFTAQKAELEKAEKARFDAAKVIFEAVNGKVYTLAAKSGDGGKLFGSVGTKEVAEAVSAAAAQEIEKHQVRMPEGVIRSTGEYELAIHLYTDLDAVVKVNVVASAE
jgi:large subunit ribosomal protein L9